MRDPLPLLALAGLAWWLLQQSKAAPAASTTPSALLAQVPAPVAGQTQSDSSLSGIQDLLQQIAGSLSGGATTTRPQPADAGGGNLFKAEVMDRSRT